MRSVLLFWVNYTFKNIIVSAWLILFPAFIFSQYKTYYEKGYKIQHFNDQKVIEPDVGDIWKDPLGHLWIVNVGNLLRYNGYEFESFQPDASTRMNDARDQFERVLVDDSGKIWLSSIQAGIVRYDPFSGTSERFRINDEAFTDFNSSHIVTDSVGNIWIGFTRGLLRIDKDDPNSFEKIEIKSLAADLFPLIEPLVNSNSSVASLLSVRNDVSEKLPFIIGEDKDITIIAQGELERTQNYGLAADAYKDLGWITDDAGDIIWKMLPENGEHAGGLIENRIHVETINLPAGSYTLHYQSDSQFAFGDWLYAGGEGAFGASWRYSAPSAEKWWGIQLLDLNGQDRTKIDERINAFQSKQALSSSYVDVFKDLTGRIWVIGHALQELLAKEDGSFDLVTYADWSLADKQGQWRQIFSICDMDEDHLWLTFGNVSSSGKESVGVGIFNKRTRSFKKIKTGLPEGRVYNSILQDNDESLWIASSNNENLFKLSPPFIEEGNEGIPRLSTFALTDGDRPIRRIKALEIDDFNNLYVGTHQQGMFKVNLDPLPFRYTDLRKAGLQDDSGITFIREDSRGNNWLVTHSLKLIRYNPSTAELETFNNNFKGIPFRYMLYMGELPNGHLLFLTRESFIEYNIADDIAIERKPEGMNWASTVTGRFASRKGIFYNDSLIYVPGHIVDIKNWKVQQDLTPLLEGSRWIATKSNEGGIWVARSWGEVARLMFEHGGTDTMDLDVSFAYNLDILEDDRGEVWIANNFNLKTLGKKGHSGQYFTASDGLKKPIYLAKIFQYENDIWQFSTLGTSVVNIESGDISHPSELAELEIEDGYQNSIGEFVLADQQGIYSFDPRQLSEDTTAPKVVIRSLAYEDGGKQSFKTNFYSSEHLCFKYDQNDIKIDYEGIQFNSPEQTMYRYQLLGLSNTWQEVKDARTANFINLLPGNYEFRVQASNGNGYQSEVKSIEFTVRPPWWKTTFAKILYVLAGLAVIYGYIQWRLRKLQLEKQEEKDFAEALIYAQEEERKRIARDLHDGVGQSLLLIKKQLDSSSQATLENRTLITATLEEVRSISQDLHPFQLEKFGLTAAIQSAIDKVEISTDLFITSNIDNVDRLLNPNAEINLYRTIQEAFNNIIKHSEATAVMIQISLSKDQITTVIKDNGKGFDYGKAASTSKSLGLKTMYERITAIGGNLRFQPVDPRGTQVNIEVPVNSEKDDQ